MKRLAAIPALAAAINLGGTVMAMHIIGISLQPSPLRELDMQLLSICGGSDNNKNNHQPASGPCHSGALSRRSTQFSDNNLRSWAWSSQPRHS